MSFATVSGVLALLVAAGSSPLVAIAAPSPSDAPASFRNDVMAVLSKAGCNMGACHGNQNGKAGFKLSLRGQDPELDFRALTRDMFARRTNPADPNQSLVLLKATMQIAHEGGLRFRRDSPEYDILRRWIAAGTPDDLASAPKLARLEVSPASQILVEPASETQLKAHAVFADGSQRDVSHLAVYEPSGRRASVSHDGLARREQMGEETVLVRYLDRQAPVRLTFVPRRADFVWKKVPTQDYIDEQVFAKLRTLRMNPSALCTDNEFARRACLDLLGLPPTAHEAREFVADRRRDKRLRLIDRLLERPEFADFWALKWSDILRNEEKVLDPKGVKIFQHWIRQSVADNKPIDQFVRELVAARGSTYANPAANYYRALREPMARAEATAQLFLGTRLQCAKCHNHPYERWTQADYYDWADVFSRVQYKILDNQRRDGLDTHEFIGEQIVFVARDGEVTNPRSGKPASPRFLGTTVESATPETRNPKPETDPDRLDALAVWLTSPDNSLFARSQVNRVWFHLMGRGIVDPIDDFRSTNPATHPALLDALAKDFVAHQFDLRYLIRLIMNSRTYQLSAEPDAANADDEVNYSHVIPRRLSAEQLFDAQHQVLGVTAQFSGYPAGLRASQLSGGTPVRRGELKASSPEMLLGIFGKPARLLTCECERSGETTMGQAFQLISGPAMNELLTRRENRLATLLASGEAPPKMIEELYWTALSRPPAEKERERTVALLEKAKDKRPALEDVTWALLNSKEFVLRP